MRFPADPQRLRSIIDVTWIVNENWLNYMEYHDREITVETMLEGYAETLEILRPYLCADPQQITRESYHTIERMAAQFAPEASDAPDAPESPGSTDSPDSAESADSPDSPESDSRVAV